MDDSDKVFIVGFGNPDYNFLGFFKVHLYISIAKNLRLPRKGKWESLLSRALLVDTHFSHSCPHSCSELAGRNFPTLAPFAAHLPHHSPTSGKQMSELDGKIVSYLAKFSGINLDPFKKNKAYPRPWRTGHLCFLRGLLVPVCKNQISFLLGRWRNSWSAFSLSQEVIYPSCVLSFLFTRVKVKGLLRCCK